MGWAGRVPSSRNVMGRAGPQRIRRGTYMGRSARPMRRLMCFDGPARTAAHDMCTTAINTATTTSTVPMRPPTCFDGAARAVAHEMWCTTATVQLRVFSVCLGHYPPKTATFVLLTCIYGKSPGVYNIICLMQMSDQSLGTVVGVQTTLLAVSATQAALRSCPGSSRGRNRRCTFVK